jgi:hypothetical protein
VNVFRGGAGHKEQVELTPGLDVKLNTRSSGSFSFDWSRNIVDYQWYGNYTVAGVNHYTFAHLSQRTVGVTARFNYTLTRDLSLQVYAQPFVSKGTFSDVRELSPTPRAARYDDRYQPYADATGLHSRAGPRRLVAPVAEPLCGSMMRRPYGPTGATPKRRCQWDRGGPQRWGCWRSPGGPSRPLP